MLGEYDHSRPTWKKVSQEGRDMILGMLNIDPVKRISASEGLVNNWILGKVPQELTTLVLNDAQNVIRQRLEAREKRHNANNKK